MIIMLVKNQGWYNVRIVNHVFVNWVYGGVSINRGQISGNMALMYDLHIAANAPCDVNSLIILNVQQRSVFVVYFFHLTEHDDI